MVGGVGVQVDVAGVIVGIGVAGDSHISDFWFTLSLINVLCIFPA